MPSISSGLADRREDLLDLLGRRSTRRLAPRSAPCSKLSSARRWSRMRAGHRGAEIGWRSALPRSRRASRSSSAALLNEAGEIVARARSEVRLKPAAAGGRSSWVQLMPMPRSAGRRPQAPTMRTGHDLAALRPCEADRRRNFAHVTGKLLSIEHLLRRADQAGRASRRLPRRRARRRRAARRLDQLGSTCGMRAAGVPGARREGKDMAVHDVAIVDQREAVLRTSPQSRSGSRR